MSAEDQWSHVQETQPDEGGHQGEEDRLLLQDIRWLGHSTHIVEKEARDRQSVEL